MILVQWGAGDQEIFFFQEYEDDEYLDALAHYKNRVPEWSCVRLVLDSGTMHDVLGNTDRKDWVVIHRHYDKGMV